MFIVRKVKGIWHCRATNLITPARCRVPTVITNMQTRANKFEIWTHPHHGRTALKWQIRFVGSLHESDRWWCWCWCAFGDGLGQKLAAKSNCIEISTSPTSSPSAAKNIKKSKLLLFSTYTKAHNNKKQGKYSLRRPPKLIIPQAVIRHWEKMSFCMHIDV